MDASKQIPGTSRWPHRLALATFWSAIPLIVLGGTVTTLRAGMAEDGWLRPDGFFLWLYPLDLRLRNLEVFVEHSHRELGSLVGLLAVLLVVVTWILDRRRRSIALALSALLAVSVQGVVGGLRVLENDPDLAFLHGALAQAVFALLATVALCLSPRWEAARPVPSGQRTEPGLSRFAVWASALAFLQVVLGAWFRHSGAELALALHGMLALGVLGVVLALARALGTAIGPTENGAATDRARSILAGMRRRLLALVWGQVALGILATFAIFESSGGPAGQVSVGEAVFATLHVAGGALLFSHCIGAALWARRLFGARPARAHLASSDGDAASEQAASRRTGVSIGGAR